MIQVRTMEEAAVLYRKVEAVLEEKEREYKSKIANYQRALDQLETVMRAMLNQAGVSSMNVPGVAEVKIVPKRTFGCGDWDMFFTWLVQNNKPELMVKRLHESNMQQWIDDNKTEEGQEQLPPGVSVVTQNVIKVLKGK